MIIQMTARHIEMIKAGKKTSTLRSLKEVYTLGRNFLPDKTEIIIKRRTLVMVAEFGIISEDDPRGALEDAMSDAVRETAIAEGYNSWEEVIARLRAMRHKLPKRMWLYTFEVMK